MEGVMLVAILVDGAAVAALLWLLRRIAREREAGLAAQRETLERLRADLAHLVDAAEERTRALDETLARREARLRAVVAEDERREPAPPRIGDAAEARLMRQLRAGQVVSAGA